MKTSQYANKTILIGKRRQSVISLLPVPTCVGILFNVIAK